MKKLEFFTLNVFRLTVENLFGLVKATIDLAIAAKSEFGDLANAALAQLTADNEKYEQVVKKPRKSELTEKLLVVNKDRNDRFSEIKRTITLHLKGRDKLKQTFAHTLDFFFTPYWDLATKPLNTETILFTEMFKKYRANLDLQTAAAKNGIDVMLTELEAVNMDYDELYKKRISEVAGFPDESASEQKIIVGNMYTQFCSVIEQAVNFIPNESVITLFKGMDELRRKYRALTPNGKDKDDDEPGKESKSE